MFRSTTSKPFTILSNIFKERPMKAGQVSGGATHSEPASGKAGNTSSSSSSSRKDSAHAKEKSSSRTAAGQPEVRSKETGLAGHYHSEPAPTSTISAHVSRDALSERQGIKSEPSGVTERSAEKSVEKSTIIHRSLKSPEKTRKSEKHEKSTAASRDERRSPPEHSSSPSRRAQPGGASPVREVASQSGAAEAASSSSSEVSYQTILPGGILVEPAAKPRSHARSGKTSSGEGTGKQRMSPPLPAEPGPGYISIPTMSLSSLSSSDEISYQTVLPGGQLAPVNKPRSPGKPGKTVSGEGSEKSATSSARSLTSPSQSSIRSTIVTPAGEPPPYKFAAESGRRPRTGSAGASDAARLSTAAKHQTASATATRATTVGTTTTATATTSTAAGATNRLAIPSGHISLSPPLKPHGEATTPGFSAMGEKKRASPPQQSHAKSSGASRTRTLQGAADSARADDESSSTISISTSAFSQLSIGGSASRRGKGGAGEEHQKRLPASVSSSGKVRRGSLDDTSSSSRSSEHSSEYSSERIVPGMRKAKSYTKPGGSRLDDFSQSEDRSGSLSRSANLASTPPFSAKASTSTAKVMDSADQSHTDAASRQPRVPVNVVLTKKTPPPRPPFDLQKAMEAPDTLDELRHPDAPLPWEMRKVRSPEDEIEQHMWDPEEVIEGLQYGGLDDWQRFQAKRLWVLRPLKDKLVDAVYQTDRIAFAATFATLHEKTIAYGQEYQLPHPWGLEATLSKVLQEIVTDPLAHASTLRWLTTQLAAKVPAEHLPVPWRYAVADVFKAAYAEKTPGKYTEQFNVLHEHCWRVGGGRARQYLVMEMKSLAARISREEEQNWAFKNHTALELQSIHASPLCMAMWPKILSVPRVFMQECKPGGNKQATAMATETAHQLSQRALYGPPGQPHLSQSQFHDYVMLACQHDKVRFVDDLVCSPEIRPGSGIFKWHMDVETANARTRGIRTHIEAVAKEFGATKILTYLAHWADIVPYQIGKQAWPEILDTLFGPIWPDLKLDKKPDTPYSPTGA